MIEMYDENLNIYINHRVVLWGAGKIGKEFHDLLKSLECEVLAFCDNNEKLWGTKIDNTPVISPNKLKDILAQSDDVVVQVALLLEDYTSLISKLESIGVTCCFPVTQLKYLRLINSRLHQHNTEIKQVQNNILIDADLIDIEYALERKTTFVRDVAKNPKRYPILFNLPFETGLENIYKLIPDTQQIYNFDSCPQGFDSQILGFCDVNKKLITAVRDPISQNMAFVHKMLRREGFLEEAYYIKLAEHLEDITPQMLFDKWMRETGYEKGIDIPESCTLKTMKLSRDIQGFVRSFCKHVLDITAQPFDKQKGFSIMQGDNIEVFVYQYERLKEILPELSKWLGVCAIGIEINETDNLFQKDIKLSREYVEKCYSEPFVSHFYSDEDIERFKNSCEGRIV